MADKSPVDPIDEPTEAAGRVDGDGVSRHDASGDILDGELQDSLILGYSLDEVARMSLSDVLSDEQIEAAREDLWRDLARRGFASREIDVLTKSGSTLRLVVDARVASREHDLRRIIGESGDAKAVVDRDGIVEHLSPGAMDLLGRGAADCIGRPVFDMIHPDDVETVRSGLAAAVSGDEARNGEFRIMHADGAANGAARWLAFTAHGGLDDSGTDAIFVNLFDVTDRKENELRLIELAKFQTALMHLVEESLQEGLTEDFYGRVLSCAVDVIPGAQAGSLLAKDAEDRCHFLAAEGFDLEELRKTFLYEHELHRDPELTGPQIVTGFQRKKLTDEERSAVLYDAGKGAAIAATLSTPIELEGSPVMYFHLDNFDDSDVFSPDAVKMARAFSNHIATLLKRFRLEGDLRQERIALDTMAYTDALTGLPNRRMFYRRAHEVFGSMESDTAVAVLFIDLDAFKEINDTLGHQVGDLLLEAVGKRLVACVRDGDTVSRWGGDEFVLLLPEAGSRRGVEQLAERIIERINAPYSLGDLMISIGCSIGVAMADGRYEVSIDDLTREADIALYQAKGDGRNRHQVFSDSTRTRALGRRNLELDLGAAIEDRSLSLLWTPRVDMASGDFDRWVVDVVWDHPVSGRIERASWLAAADRDGLARALFEMLLGSACERLPERGHTAEQARMSVGMWPALFRVDDLLESTVSILRKHGIEPSRIELSIPESSVTHGDARTSELLVAFRELGFALSMQGYGSAPLSVGALRASPIETLVVPGGLVEDARVETAGKSRQVLAALLAMARELEMTTVADGVETTELAELASELGFDRAQGPWYAVQSERSEGTPDRRARASRPSEPIGSTAREDT